MTDDVNVRVVTSRLEGLLSRASYERRGCGPILNALDKHVGNRYYTDPDGGVSAGTPKPDEFPVEIHEENIVRCFKESQLPDLEAVSHRLEQELAKPKYLIRSSRAVEKLILQRSGEDDRLLKLIKACPDATCPGADVASVLDGMRTHAELVPGPPMTLAVAHQVILVFVGDEESALARVAAVQAPPRKANPEKVAVKMVVLRFRKLRDYVKQLNGYASERLRRYNDDMRAWRAAPAGQAGPEPVYYEDQCRSVPGVPTEGGRGAITEYVNTLRGRHVSDSIRDLRKVLSRQDISDAVIEEAMKVSQVEDVMES